MKKITLVIVLLLLSLALFGCNNNDQAYQQRYDTMYNHLVDCWAQSLEEIHFDNAFYGDSRVIGGNFTGEFANKSVVNLGVGGDKINDLINRFALIKSTTPNRVFLSIGGNDCLSEAFSVETFTQQYKQLLDLFKQENIDCVIHNIVGVTVVNSTLTSKDVDKANEKIQVANAVLQQIALQYNYTFVDIASKMNNANSTEMNGLYSADGVHFNAEGYKVWFDEIRSLVL